MEDLASISEVPVAILEILRRRPNPTPKAEDRGSTIGSAPRATQHRLIYHSLGYPILVTMFLLGRAPGLIRAEWEVAGTIEKRPG